MGRWETSLQWYLHFCSIWECTRMRKLCFLEFFIAVPLYKQGIMCIIWSYSHIYRTILGKVDYKCHTHTRPPHFTYKRTATSPAGLGDIRTRGSSALISLCTEDKHVLSTFTAHNGKPRHTMYCWIYFHWSGR